MALTPRIRPVWGIDIAASAIKGVRMCVDGDRVRILAADILPLEGDPALGDRSGRDRRVWRGLQRFQTKHGLGAEPVAVGLPGPLFFVRPFNFVLLGDRTEEELVRYEMEQHIPFGLDAVLWDYDLFGSVASPEREREGLLFAIKKDALNDYMLSLSAAAIDPHLVQAAPLALYHFIHHEMAPDRPTLVADLGAATTNLLAIDGRRYWVRTLNLGGEAITGAVQAAFGRGQLDREEAEEIKTYLPRFSRREEVAERLVPDVRRFVGELRNAITHLSDQHQLKFERMVLVGGAGGMYGLPRLLSEELKVPVVTPAGLGNIEVDDAAGPGYVNANLPSLCTPIGLGLQALGKRASRVNIFGAALSRRRSQGLMRWAAGVAATVFLVLVVAAGCIFRIRSSVMADGVRELRKTLAPVNSRDSRSRSAGIRIEGSRDMLQKRQDFAARRNTWLQILDTVTRMLPENDKPSLRPEDKLWLIGLSLNPKGGNPRGDVKAGEIEVGVLLREGDLAYARNIIEVPLTKDEKGRFKKVVIAETKSSPTLSWSGDKGRDKYTLVKWTFEVEPKGTEGVAP